MADYTNLKNSIRSAIKANGNNEITGNLLQQILIAMVSNLGAAFQFAGRATQSTNPGTPDYNVAYLAGPGTYQNMGGAVVPSGYIGVLTYNGSWDVQLISVGGSGGSVITFNSLPNGTTVILVDGVPQAVIPSQYTLLKLSAFTTTPSGLADGSFYYNTSDKKIYQKRDPTVAVIPYYDGAIYTYNNALYVWNGTDLVNVGGGGGADFLTEPDDLTLEAVGNTNILKFANRSYNSQNPNGMGYKILRKDATFASQVTETNTIYEIRYNFDLGGASVTIPAGCVVKFVGGSLNNGTIDFTNCAVESDSPCLFGITPVGLNDIHVKWFDILPGVGHDIGAMLTALVASLNYKASLIFERNAYYTTTTITISGSYNIIGFPTFTTAQENMKCISISSCSDSTLQFNVQKTTKALWKDNGSIGVELVGLLRCTIEIEKISQFTYGVEMIAKAGVATGGFAWNNIHISSITAALQSIVIISEDAWPNANIIYNTSFFRYSGQWDATGATEPIRYIVFKNDGKYGMSGWGFIGFNFENNASNSPTIAGKPFVNVDFQTYVTQNPGNNISIYNIFIEGRTESTGNFMLVNSQYCSPKGISVVTKNNVVTNVPFAIDEHNKSVVGSLVDVGNTENIGERHLIHVAFDDVSDLWGDKRISPDGRICGMGIYSTITRQFSVYGTDAKCVIFKTPCRLRINATGTLRISALDDAFTKIDNIGTGVYIIGRGQGFSETYKMYYRSSSARRDCFVNSLDCEYVAVAVLNGEMDIYELYDGLDNPVEIVSPFGKTAGIIKTLTYWNALRATVKPGQRIYDGQHLYTVLVGGSIGNINYTATGIEGENIVTVNASTYLFAGDIVSIDGKTYEIVSKTATTITLDKPLETSPSSSPITFVAPITIVD